MKTKTWAELSASERLEKIDAERARINASVRCRAQFPTESDLLRVLLFEVAAIAANLRFSVAARKPRRGK